MSKKSTNPQLNNKTLHAWAKKNKGMIIAVGIILIIAIIFDVLVTGYIKFGYNVVRCGGLPVKVSYSFLWGSGSWYDVPALSDYVPGGASSTYYCTPSQAEAQGIPPDPFSAYGRARVKDMK